MARRVADERGSISSASWRASRAARGCLVGVGAARDDASVLAALRPYVVGDCLVAFDAPLVVANRTGQRPAEAALNRDFRQFEAGAYPANTAAGPGEVHADEVHLPRVWRGRGVCAVVSHPSLAPLSEGCALCPSHSDIARAAPGPGVAELSR